MIAPINQSKFSRRKIFIHSNEKISSPQKNEITEPTKNEIQKFSPIEKLNREKIEIAKQPNVPKRRPSAADLDAILTPIPGGRVITITRTPRGLVVSTRIVDEPAGHDTFYFALRNSPTADLCEMTYRGASLLYGRDFGADGSDTPLWHMRWVEHPKPHHDEPPRLWLAIADDEDAARWLAWEVGFRWRARMVEPRCCAIPPWMVRETNVKNCTQDQ